MYLKIFSYLGITTYSKAFTLLLVIFTDSSKVKKPVYRDAILTNSFKKTVNYFYACLMAYPPLVIPKALFSIKIS